MGLRIRAAVVTSLSVLLAQAAVLGACDESRPAAAVGGNSSDGGPGTNPSQSDGGSTDTLEDGSVEDSSSNPNTEDASSTCNVIESDSALVPQASATGPQPAATGGTIFPGTYYLTERLTYGGAPDGLFKKRVLVVDTETKTIDMVEGTAETADGTPPLTRSSATYQVFDGTLLNLELSCPTPGETSNTRFTAGGATLTLYLTASNVEVYMLQ
jgi:hypothetical protein